MSIRSVTTVLIPGLVCDGHVWHATRAALEAEGLTVAVADVTAQPTIPAMAEDILARHPGPLLAIGHSMGARVAMEMAAQAPDRIAGLGLLNTGMHPMTEAEPPKREAKIALAHERGMDALAEDWLPGMLAQGVDPDPEVLAGLQAMVRRMTPEIHERQIRALMARPDASLTLPDWRGPILLLTGDLDAWSPLAQHEAIAALCPQAELHLIAGAGHFAPVEKPAETAEILLRWTKATLSEGLPA